MLLENPIVVLGLAAFLILMLKMLAFTVSQIIRHHTGQANDFGTVIVWGGFFLILFLFNPRFGILYGLL